MPWKETNTVKERVKFVLEWERRWNEARGGPVNIAELCRVFGVSRQTGHVWLKRFQDAGHDIRVLEDRSHRPHHSPTAVAEEMEDFIVAARKAHPRWGPRKLYAWLRDRHPELVLPKPSCVGKILMRRGLVRPRKRRRRVVPMVRPFGAVTKANALWCVDFKGKFRLGNGEWCHVLTVVDAYSRFLVRCEVVDEPTGYEVQRIFDSAFAQYGLPDAIRSDNGAPFASRAAGGLTQLSVWWLRLGIRVERIEPGKPQQNGRQERLHLTLEEVVSPPRRNRREQQRALDEWRKEYNEERPHEALGQAPPESAFRASSRQYPRPLLRLDPPPWAEQCVVDKQGMIRWRDHRIFVTTALWRELVGITPGEESETFAVHFGDLLLGIIDEERIGRGLQLAKRINNPPSRITVG